MSWLSKSVFSFEKTWGIRNRHFVILDLILLPAATVIAFILRLNTAEFAKNTAQLMVFIGISVPVKMIVFRYLGIYGRLWRYASVDELILIVTSSMIGALVSAGLLFGVALPIGTIAGFPRSIPFIDAILTMIVVGGPRFAVRRFYSSRESKAAALHGSKEKAVLIIGAGDAGAMIAKEMRTNPALRVRPIGFIDDDETKYGIRIHGIPVLGSREQMLDIAKENHIEEIIIALPSARGSVVREILRVAANARIPARTIPALHDIISGRTAVSQLREVQIEDLLRRETIHIDSTAVDNMIKDRRVLITGAGGSIGRELAIQVSACGPKSIILMGHGENSIFFTRTDLPRMDDSMEIHQIIADLRDESRIDGIFGVFKPEIVFHAAAHKHVPLMELNPGEAVSNNVRGTQVLLNQCEKHGVDRFVFISTDKAVNPTSIMGATKRVAEILVHDTAVRSGMPYVSVRFGNVLGSRGSVVPLFRAQIAKGGPITVTDPHVKRYFMTIPEAVQLVLQAAALGTGGEVILLDMGEQIKIADLAKDLIELSGLEVEKDIPIVFTGLRPGEKLEEELFIKGEEYEPMSHEKLFQLRNNKSMLSGEALQHLISELIETSKSGSIDGIRAKIKKLVPEAGWK